MPQGSSYGKKLTESNVVSNATVVVSLLAARLTFLAVTQINGKSRLDERAACVQDLGIEA